MIPQQANTDRREDHVGVDSLAEIMAAIDNIADVRELRELESLIRERVSQLTQANHPSADHRSHASSRSREGKLPSAASLMKTQVRREKPGEVPATPTPVPKPHLYRPKPTERPVRIANPKPRKVQPVPPPARTVDRPPTIAEPVVIPSIAATKLERREAKTRNKEYSVAVRWWNAPIALAGFLGLAGLFTLLGLETARVGMPMAELRARLTDPDATVDSILQSAKRVPSSPIFRYDARRDYLLAEASKRAAEGDGVEKAHRVQEARAWLARAMTKSPTSLTYRLAWAESLEGPGAEKEYQRLEKFAPEHPLVLAVLAERTDPSQDLPLALERYGRLLRVEPDRSKEVSLRLREKLVPWQEIIPILPPSPSALASVTELLDPHAHSELKDAVQLRLTEITNSVSNAEEPSPTGWEWWAIARVHAWLGADDLAVEAGEKAASLGQSTPEDLLFLAEECCRVRQFDDAERWVSQVLASRPSEEAKRSAEKVQSLVTAAREEPVGLRPGPPPTLQAH